MLLQIGINKKHSAFHTGYDKTIKMEVGQKNVVSVEVFYTKPYAKKIQLGKNFWAGGGDVALTLGHDSLKT